MATNITLNGVSYSIPAVGESAWGTSLSAFLIALPTGVLTKAGGSFPLTAVADFGANHGVKSLYFSARTTPSSTGVIRLGASDSVGWRNAANSADLLLNLSSDKLFFNSNPVVTLANAAAHTVLKMNAAGTTFEYDSLTDASISASAAIAYSKLNLATSIVNADINASAAIAYSKLNLSGSVVNADINASAAIAWGKLAPGIEGHVLISGAGGVMNSEAALAKSRGGTGADNSSVTFPTTGTIVTEAGTQTLSNKTLATPYTTTGNDLESLGSAPANPSAGRVRLYVESGTLKTRDSSGTVTSFGAGLANLNGLTGSTQTFAVGTSGTDFAISSSGTAHTFNIPDAGASARGLITTGTQTLSGPKSFSSLLSASAGLNVTGANLGVGTTSPVTAAHLKNTATPAALSGLLLDAQDANNNAIALINRLDATQGNGFQIKVVTDGSNNTKLVFAGENTPQSVYSSMVFENCLELSENGAITAGLAGSSSTGLQHTFLLPAANSVDAGFAGQATGSLRIASGSANRSTTLVGKQTTNNTAGLTFIAGSSNTNSSADMVFDVRENDNSDFSTLSTTAYRFDRFGSQLGATTRSGEWTFNGGAKFSSAGGQSAMTSYIEEGAFTPTLTCVTPGTLSVTYITQAGEYTRIGNVVYFSLYLSINTLTPGTATGSALISGLPFTGRGSSTRRFLCNGAQYGTALANSGDYPAFQIADSTNRIYLSSGTAAGSGADLQIGAVNNATDWYVNGFYFVD